MSIRPVTTLLIITAAISVAAVTPAVAAPATFQDGSSNTIMFGIQAPAMGHHT